MVVGSSAGGVEALSELLRGLPGDLAAPVVIAQHLDPSRESHLQDILGRQTSLPVRTVTDRMPLEPGVAFVVPADRHVEVTDHELSLSDDSTGPPKPSVNLLLTSAAEVFGEGLVAVILTGTGSDGAVGAAAVKQAGGTVIIQNPETARFPGMPRSLAPAVVDIVAELHDIGPIIARLVAGEDVASPAPEVERELQAVLHDLRVLRGVDFTSYRMPMIERRLQRRMAATGSADLPAYRRYLGQHEEEQAELLRAFLIKVTEFFRDEELYSYLGDRLLPRLVLEAQQHDAELRLWSAGCATGQEAYSLAILLAEQLGNELERAGVRIFATDLDASAIEFARSGVYPRTAVEHLPPELLERYFNRTDGEFEVSKRIRSMVIFGEHDLVQRAPFPHIDLVLCRNVLMYFTTELQRRALHLFAFALRDGGALVLGKSESLNPLPEYFEPEQAHLRIYRRHGDRALIPAAMALHARGSTERHAASSTQRPATEHGSRRDERAAPQAADSISLGLLTVDRHYDIVSINPAARRLLGIHDPGRGEDLIHLLSAVNAEQVRSAIDASFRSQQPVKLDRLPLTDPASAVQRWLDVAVYPAGTRGDQQAGDAVFITVAESSLAPVQERPGRDESEAVAESPEQVRRRLDLALKQLTELREANDRLLITNEDLSQSQQQLMTDNFAVQAASEEVETLNEELHATNEELETLNEEMQATLEELQATNDDMASQSADLQRLSHEHEAQRRHLELMVNSIGDAVLVIDAEGHPILKNPAYEALFGVAPAAFQAEYPDGTPIPAGDTPQQRAARGEDFSVEFVAQAIDGTRRWLEATSRPFETDGERQSILIIRDVTDRSLRRVQERFLAIASHELRTPLTSLLGQAQLLSRSLQRGEIADSFSASLGTVLEQARRLSALTEDLLDASRLRGEQLKLQPTAVELGELVERVVELEKPLAGPVEIRFERPIEPVLVQGDGARLEQVVINLVNNALVHSRSERIDLRVKGMNEQAVIEVQDYGRGIPVAQQAHLFDAFFQVRSDRPSQQGMGLGLYISRELVAAHGGTLEVESVEGQGATFTIRLPLQGTAAH